MKRDRFTTCLLMAVGMVSALLAGCVPARSLAPLAELNVRNTADLAKSAEASSLLARTFAGATSFALLKGRLDMARMELESIVTQPGLKADATWEDAFSADTLTTIGGRLAKSRRRIEQDLAVATQEQKDAMAKAHGWVYASVADSTFTLQRARKILKSVDLLKNLHGGRDFVVHATKLLRQVDGRIAYWDDVTRELDCLIEAVDEQLGSQLTNGHVISMKLAQATKADVDLAQTLKTVLAGDAAGALIEGLAGKYIRDEEVRNGVVTLYRDTVGTMTK